MTRKWVPGLIITVSCFVLATCPNPLDKALLLHVRDEIAPVITVASPAGGSLCANIVEVLGQVTDAATSGGKDGRVRSLSYSVPGSAVASAIEFDPDGSFSFQFLTITLSANFTLAITATDWNGNTGTASLALVRVQGNGIPSFSAHPGDEKATLTWEAVPNAASYTLYYSINGSLPSDEVGVKLENVTSPCIISNLFNGNLQVFRLRAVPREGWPECLSDYVKLIPLSELTLAPRMTAEPGQIHVEWNAISASASFEVWRSTERDGAYKNLSGPITGTSYIDRDVVDGTWYYYRVRLAEFENGPSAPNAAQTSPWCLHAPPLVCSRSSFCEQAWRVCVSGTDAYLVSRDKGLHIFDISNPESASLVGGFDTAGVEWDIAVSGHYAYLAAETEGLVVLDVSTPAAPYVAGTYHTPGNAATGVAISGSHAFVCDDTSLQVLDVSNPANPSYVGSWAGNTLFRITIQGTIAYVTGYENGVYLIDISNPSSPALLSQRSIPGNTALAATVNGSTLYVAARTSGLVAVDVSNLSSPTILGTCPVNGDALDVQVVGSYALVPAGQWGAGVKIVDISDPSSMKLAGQAYTPGVAESVVLVGEHIYIADWARGLSVARLRFPRSPTIIGSVPSSSGGVDVIVRDGYAFVADKVTGLQVIDVSRPDAPYLAGASVTAFKGCSVTISGSHAYVGTNEADGAFYVVDISSASSPRIVGSCLENWGCNGVAASGSHVYAAGWSGGLRVLDVSNPSAPRIVGLCVALYTSDAKDVAVSGRYAYVAYETDLAVIDISNPELPTLSGLCDSPVNAIGVTVNGSYAYVADELFGLRIIDASDPTNPIDIGDCPLPNALTVVVSGPYAFVRGWTQLYVVDVWDPASPTLLSTLEMPSCAGIGVSTSGDYVYTAGDSFQVIDLGQ
jgi:hypothetical protein